MRVVILAIIIFFSNFAILLRSYPNTLEDARILLSRDNFISMFYKYEDFTNLLLFGDMFDKFVDKSRYIIYEITRDNFSVVYIPLSVEWIDFYNSLVDKIMVSDVSFLLKVDNQSYYIKLETNNYISVFNGNFINNYNNLLKGLSQEYFSGLIKFLPVLIQTNLSGFFSYPLGNREVSNLLNLNIGLFDRKYNFLSDISYVSGYVVENGFYGSAFLNRVDKIRNIYTPVSRRQLNVLSQSEIPFYLTISVNPEFLSDVVELLYPDLISAYPRLKRDIVNTFSGTIFVGTYSPIYSDNIDIVVLMGVKSKSEADRFIKSILGLLGNYKITNISRTRVFEILLQNNLKVYLYLSDNEVVLTSKANRIDDFITLYSRKASSLVSRFPTIGISGNIEYVSRITENDLESFKRYLFKSVFRNISLILDITDDQRQISIAILN